MSNAWILALALAGCATPPKDDAPRPIDVQSHVFEVPRNPHPAYHPDGVQITRLKGESAWTRAGLRVGDIVESVNGEPTFTPEQFRKAAGGDRPGKVRVTGSRLGNYGTRLVSIETVP